MKKVIEFRKVKKQFGEKVILNQIDFSVEEGEIVFILGTSGTGKSVLLKTLVGLLRADAGEVFIDGVDVTHFTEEELFPIRQKCGMVFQSPALFDSLSIFENVAYGIRRHFDWSEDEIQKNVLSCLSLVHLQGQEQKFPNQISYGMQKRVSLARTVAIRPKILLFDEPTTGLDPITTGAINRLIQELSRKLKTTSLVVSHDMRCALEIADRIIVLEKGDIVAQGTPKNLMNSEHQLVRDFLSEVREEFL